MKNKLKFFSIIIIVTMLGFSFITCDDSENNDGNNSNSGNNSGYSWSQWYTINLSSGSSGAQFILQDSSPRSLEIQIQGATPTSFSLSSYGSQHAIAPQAGATIQYRYRLSGFGIQANSITGPIVRFVWLGEFAAQ